MTKSEKALINRQIEQLRKRRDSLVDEFIGRCDEINVQIKALKKLKEGLHD